KVVNHAETAPAADTGDTPSWLDRLADRLQAYAEGQPDDFRDVAVDLDCFTRFQQRVLRACRTIPYGQTVCYADLAARCGSPAAARAVGNVMSNNRLPLIVPCHRVVGSAGRLGGFSAPGGLAMKRRLLRLEAAHAPCA
ncbi:MAG: methylated-DNA--[protein]-cysteine S-methyltransferase, partial [Planctomycetales bacterium]|nr:methylated-DNA--[protein]-cysteine S-methyltransferase [Planctomycetales bacterium]NIM10313.1 methylated-DNA--[protein]-cysteine S-methyltransferase [Planctomycetales bacterium]NIN09760.1 methylated-DNA--[protein]-cysteine S-methyltransferase [Planctomycetales bacterium]NIN78883.1 methylated-DNA--[protein]-cysteine S-methyltransferase [Planctomycetales bacterium]NIO36054.1 methylated-DNA--[protein]-cysteine S-methyltransferase [Planctomycetales bacterium]